MLKIENLEFEVNTEEGKRKILSGVNLTLGDGKLVVITGPNGSGKSTLAKAIAGINKPTAGKIFLDGKDITSLGVTERAKEGISFAFQQPVKFKGITVFDLIKIATGKEIAVHSACEYLSMVGLCAKDYIDREVNSSLSGGELKRIEIATVIARGSKVSLFDEPEAGIDLWSFKNLIDVFKKMRAEINGGSILVISHQERILDVADEVVVLKHGKIVGHGSKEEMLPKLIGTANATLPCRKVEG